MKKVFIISSILLLLALIFLGIYNFVFSDIPVKTSSSKIESSISNSSLMAGNKEENIKDEKIKLLTDEAVISPAFSLDGKYIQYYSKENGNVWKISLDGSEKINISQDILTGLTRVLWSPKENKVISRFPQNKFYLYDHAVSEGRALKKGISDIAWTNLGDKIIYNYCESKIKACSLNLANPDGSRWKKIADLRPGRISIAPIPQSSLISYWNYPDASSQTFLKTISLVGGEPKTIFSGKYGADYLWSPDGKKVLVSSLTEKGNSKIMLGFIENDGEKYQALNVPTLVSKCVWADEKNVYCAIPTSIPDDAMMPDDYYNKKITTKDTFFKINVLNGKSERIVDLEEITSAYDAENLMVSLYEGCLFFVNRIDGKLYRIDI
ncbi:hypothetical protein J7J13_01475 [bacterium]|nr:hypothetical protein [bacterium]